MKFKDKIIFFSLLFVLNGVFASDYYTVIKTKTLNIQNGPGENFPVVGSLSLGDTILIDSIISPWCHIKDSTKTKGYVNGWYLSKIDKNTIPKKTEIEQGFIANFLKAFKILFAPILFLFGYYGTTKVKDGRRTLTMKQVFHFVLYSGIISTIIGLIIAIIFWIKT